MYQVSQDYLSKIYTTKHILDVYLNGVRVESQYILGFRYDQTVFDNEQFSLGSTPFASVELKIHNNAIPVGLNVTRVYIETGIIGETFPIGYFNVDDVKKTDYITTFSLVDDMVKLDREYDGSALFENNSATLLDIWNDICEKFEIESGMEEFNGDDVVVGVYDSSLTARQYIGMIAEQAGGFAVIGRDGKLYIRQIGQSVIQYNKVYLKQGFHFTNGFKITRVKYEDGIQDFRNGDETGNTLYISQDNMYIVSQNQIDTIYGIYNNMELNGFSGSGIIDPAIDMGDILVVDGKQFVYQGSMAYVGKYLATISSDIQSKEQEETTSRHVSQRTINRRVESKINQMTGEIVQLVQEIDGVDGSVNQRFTQIYQDINNIVNTVQNAGGANLIRNSVMFAYDSEGNPSEWDVSNTGTLTIASSAEALANGGISGHVFILNDKTASQRITVVADSETTIDKTYYTFSCRASKNTVGTAYIKIYNDVEEYQINLENGTSYYYQQFEQRALLPKSNYYIIELYGSADSNATFTDLMLNVGEYKTQWQQANGEIMNTQVNINIDGVLVKSTVYEGDYTVMSPLEFAGYSNVNGVITKVFSLNRDTTEIKKLKVDNGIVMPPIKIVPITTGTKQGWAFVPYSEQGGV